MKEFWANGFQVSKLRDTQQNEMYMYIKDINPSWDPNSIVPFLTEVVFHLPSGGSAVNFANFSTYINLMDSL